MYPFWDSVIAPLLRVSGGRRVVEIGALRGETTVKMLDDLGPDSEVHVIDPVPAFDPGEHEQQFPGRYVFHRELSVNVLGDLGAFDVALVDGDHNWYTVYNEMRLLAAAARSEDKPLPLSILHDVCWPYGRRDLYYDPSNVPAEHRQPYEYRGMRPGRAELLKKGGMNVTLANAVVEGGEHNGVMTGLDDFMAEYDRPLRRVVLPIYFGLAIVVETATLEARPELRAFLDQLESPEGTRELLELSEAIRLDGVVFEHNIDRVRNDRLERAIERHLDMVRATLSAPDEQLDRLDDAIRTTTGDIVHTGSADALRFILAALDAREMTDRLVWVESSDDPPSADNVRIVARDGSGAITAEQSTVDVLSVSDPADASTLREQLGGRVAADLKVVNATT